MDRRRFLQAAGLGVTTLACGAVDSSSLPKRERATEHGRPLQEFHYSQVDLEDGLQQTQLEQTHTVLMNLSEDSLLRPFRRRAGLPAPGNELGGWYSKDEYGPSTFGQWISALARYYAITGEETTRTKIDRLVRAYATTIEPTGKFYEQYPWSAYTYDKLVCGLMDAHQFAHQNAAMDILSKATKVVLRHLPDKPLTCVKDGCDEEAGFHSYTLPENQFIAWQRGGSPRHFELAQRYLHHAFFDPLGRGEDVLAGGHAYGHVNALCSAAKAYLVLGEAQYLEAAKNGFRFVEAQSFATGGWGPDETFLPHPKPPTGNSPVSRNLGESLINTHDSFETPDGAYAHFKLTRYLLRITKDSAYGDSMERVMYNTILGAKPLQPDGRAFYYADYHSPGRKIYPSDKPDITSDGKTYGFSNEKWHCCSGTLPQIAADYRISAYFHDTAGVFVNLFIPSTVRWQHNGAKISLTQTGQYPLADTITFVLTTSRPTEFVIRLRIPMWSQRPAIHINGQLVAQSVQPGTFTALRRQWRTGDRIELELPRKLELKAVDAQHPDTVAVAWGPLVLFAIADNVPKVTRQQLLAAEQQGQASAEWIVHGTDGPIRFLPFWVIEDQHYSTYLSVA